MSTEFFQQIASRNGLFGIVLQPTERMGEKAFYSQVHPIVEKVGTEKFWSNFFEQLSPKEELPTVKQCPDGTQIFVERIAPKPKLVILGGGHVALSVYELGIMLGFETTVVDDREEFCNRERFPNAAECLCMPYTKALEQIPSGENVYYVIVTRGHQWDDLCIQSILRKESAYIGMIGSRRKAALMKENLLQCGFRQEQIEKIFSPIGLDIGAETPEEIAISIMAELIQQKNLHGAGSSANDEALSLLAEYSGRKVFCMIIEKQGSIPRGAGSKMVVTEDGQTAGSIGGGKIEFDVYQEALTLCREGAAKAPILRAFVMDGASAKADGMVCGGSAVVYIESYSGSEE